MALTYRKLRGRIVEMYGNQTSFAESLGIAKQTLSRKLNGSAGITKGDIELWSAKLMISTDEIGSYFFS